MVGEQDPLDAFHADLRQMIQHTAVAQVDEQRGIAIPEHIDIAGVGPDQQIGRSRGIDWAESRRAESPPEPGRAEQHRQHGRGQRSEPCTFAVHRSSLPRGHQSRHNPCAVTRADGTRSVPATFSRCTSAAIVALTFRKHYNDPRPRFALTLGHRAKHGRSRRERGPWRPAMYAKQFRVIAGWALAGCLMLFFAAGPLRAAPPLLKAGFAERDITPELGMEQPGGYGKAYHQTLHDPCKVRAAVFDDGRHRVALVGIDALVIRREMVETPAQEIQRQCGIPAEAILIGASHSHSSGPLGMCLPGEFDDASPLVQKLAYEKSTLRRRRLFAAGQEQIVDAAVCRPIAARVEARCGVGKGIEDKVAFNRRFRMNNGRTFTHPGQGNPDIVEPAGPIDPAGGRDRRLGHAGQVAGLRGQFRLPCHDAAPAASRPTGSTTWSRRSAARSGPEAVVVFLPGACGDVTQVDNLNPDANPDAETLGPAGGRHASAPRRSRCSWRCGRARSAPLDARSKMLEIPRRRPSPERVRQCLAMVQKDPKEVDATEWTFAKEIVLLDALLAKRPTAEVEVQAIQVGPAVLAGQPGRVLLPVGAGHQGGAAVPVHLPRDAGQRLRGLRADGRGLWPARRRLRNAVDQLQQP